MKYRKSCMLGLLFVSILGSTNLLAREYGEIMTIHSGQSDSTGKAIIDCYVKIKRESNNTITPWLRISTGSGHFQPTGCAILLSAYVSDKRIGYDLSSTSFSNICLADKMDC